MVVMLRLFSAIVLSASAAFAAGVPGAPRDLARSVTIYRDTYGVPHIYAKTDAGAAFGLMYAQAEDNFWQLETDMIRAHRGGRRSWRGRAGWRATSWSARTKARNARRSSTRARHPGAARAVRRLRRGRELLPGDSSASEAATDHALRAVVHPGGGASRSGRGRDYAGRAAEGVPRTGRGIRCGRAALSGGSAGSGARYRGRARTCGRSGPAARPTATPCLLINPHVGFFGGGQRYEAHLHSGEGLDVSGFAILGTPYIRSGHNRYLGWSHTNNYAQTADVYVETFDDPGDPLSYRYGAGHRKAVEWTDEIRVKTERGVETRTIEFRKTHHGPILGMRDGKGLAVRAAAADGRRDGAAMGHGEGAQSARVSGALAKVTLTGSNTIYADRAGNIYYLHGNAIPRRPPKVRTG